MGSDDLDLIACATLSAIKEWETPEQQARLSKTLRDVYRSGYRNGLRDARDQGLDAHIHALDKLVIGIDHAG